VTNSTDFETAERLGKRRSRAVFVLAIFFMMQQATYFSGPDTVTRPVDYVRIGGWLAMSAVLLVGLTSSGFWFRPRRVRELLDDEVTRANRADAVRFGFMAAMTASIALYIVSLFETMTGRQAIHLIMTMGIGLALLRFGFLERRAQADG